MTLWKGRFSKGMSEAMRDFSVSLDTDWRLLPYDLSVNAVWAKELCTLGILNKAELSAIENALKQIAEEANTERTTDNGRRTTDEDVHSYVERRLTELAGDAGAKIHTGRSRNDQVMTDLRLYAKDACTALQELVRHAIEALVAQAAPHQATILPGYTHMQQAQPISLAHYLLSAATVLHDDHARLDDAAARIDRCPLGSGAIAGSAYPIDRTRLATDLGFASPTANSIAAISMRDECLELASACATIMIHLSRYAEDWILWSGQEFRFVTFDDGVTTGSSMMPQKKNPDALELIRGKTARVLGQMQTLFTLLKGLPLTYARDLQEDKPALFDLLDQTAQSLLVFTECVSGATFHAARMAEALDPSLFATELADYLVKKGIPFRKAHEIVGDLVQKGTALTAEAIKKHSKDFGDDVAACLDPRAALAQRNCIGGTGPASVSAQIKTFQAWFKSVTAL